MLDQPIGIIELESVIKSLKRNKASGPDNILNEFLLNASTGVKLFTLILFKKNLDLEYFGLYLMGSR